MNDSDKKLISIFTKRGMGGSLRESYFQRKGCVIQTVSDEDELFKSFEKDKPDMVIVDYSADFDNSALCRKIKASPKTYGIKVLLVLSGAADRMKGRALTSGCDAFLSEPFKESELLEATSKLLNIKQRKEVRIFVKLSARVQFKHQEVYGETIDVSLSGMFIRTRTELKKGDSTEVEFMLPGYDRFIKTTTQVMRADFDKIANDYGLALQFISLAPLDSMMIREFIEKERNGHR